MCTFSNQIAPNCGVLYIFELLVKLYDFRVLFAYARLRTGGVKVMTHLSTLTTWDVGITSLKYDHHTLCLLVSIYKISKS